MENLTKHEKNRITEIAFYQIYYHLRTVVPSDKFFVYIENFCRVFSVDYTSIMLASNTFIAKLKPSKYELTMFVAITGVKLNTLGLDYRTIRAHRKKFKTNKLQLYPKIPHMLLLEDLRKFVDCYFRLFLEEANYIHEYAKEGGFKNE